MGQLADPIQLLCVNLLQLEPHKHCSNVFAHPRALHYREFHPRDADAGPSDARVCVHSAHVHIAPAHDPNDLLVRPRRRPRREDIDGKLLDLRQRHSFVLHRAHVAPRSSPRRPYLVPRQCTGCGLRRPQVSALLPRQGVLEPGGKEREERSLAHRGPRPVQSTARRHQEGIRPRCESFRRGLWKRHGSSCSAPQAVRRKGGRSFSFGRRQRARVPLLAWA
mmetsp:Transcript_18433/g.52929  ORF Transcript_18433/g.52929 Transcript_18433/m.52929 type:complete len:221 (+) Transcript_18433:363-1025(+)